VKDKSNRVINTSLWHEELVDIPLQRNGYVLLIVMMILSF
jgi:sentrin-specific protease 1